MLQEVSTKKEEFFSSIWSDFFENDRFFDPRWVKSKMGLPAVNVKEDEQAFHLELAVPGFHKNEFHLEVDENILTISAEKDSEKVKDKDHFTRKEFTYESFTRSFTLPKNVNENAIDATYKDGILLLSIPKKEDGKEGNRKTIKVA